MKRATLFSYSCKKNTKRSFLVFFFVAALFSFCGENVARAAYNDLTLASTTVISGGYTLTLTGLIQNIITREQNFDVVLAPGSSLTVVSLDKKDFSVVATGQATHSEKCNTNNSTLLFSSPSAVSTSTVTITGNCAGASSPGQIASITTAVGTTTVLLSWVAPSNGGSAITDYRIEFKLASSTEYAVVNDGVSTANTATITGLVSGAGYTVRVSAVNAVGVGASSAAVSFTTLSSSPTIPATPVTPTTPVVPSNPGTPSPTPAAPGGGSGPGGSPAPVVPTVPTLPGGSVSPVSQAPKPVASNNTSAAGVTSGVTISLIANFLWKGLESSDVVNLQRFLIQQDMLVVPPGDALGFYGNKTELAVKKFQCKYSIVCQGSPASTGWGVVGSKTKNILNAAIAQAPNFGMSVTASGSTGSQQQSSVAVPSISSSALVKGSRGEAVVKVQKILIQKGFLTVSPDDVLGLYGSKTEKAVKDLQCQYNIVCQGSPASTGWGSIGPRTAKVVNSL